MRRQTLEPRPDWKQKVEALGLVFHTHERPYWDESACYTFSMAEVLRLEQATEELFGLCMQAVEHVIRHGLWQEFRIPSRFAEWITQSWEQGSPSLYGRFDLCYDGTNAPKLYEFNADTPTSLLEAAVVQWYWLQERFPDNDQFNSLHERLIEQWKAMGITSPVHFACVRNSDEDFATTVYLQDTAVQAGLQTGHLFVDEIGWNGKTFVDLEDRPIQTLFKLYPWEWLVRENFQRHLSIAPWQVIEPPWKMILSNKRILPLLWELFPGHDNLLPAYTTAEPLSAYARKPIFGREGAGITLSANGREVTSDGTPEVDGGAIYQALQLPPCFDKQYPVIGSWIIGNEPAGMGIRESSSPVTTLTSRFVPHRIIG